MNLYLVALMDKPSIPREPFCAICGRSGPVTEHHIVPRSQGGKDGPTVYLCGHGTAGCHGDAEAKKLHFRYRDGWQYLRTTPMKYDVALTHEAYWEPIRGAGA